MASLEELERKINDMSKEVETLKNQAKNIGQLIYPLSDSSEDALFYSLKNIFSSKGMELVTDNFFYIYDIPVVIDAAAFYGTWSGTGANTFGNYASGYIGLTSGTVYKNSATNDVLTWNKEQRFGTSISYTTANDFYIVNGLYSANKYYGFRVVSNVLYGVCKDGTTQSTIQIATLSASTKYDLYAKFYPQNKILFYYKVSGSSSYNGPWTVKTNLPSGINTNGNIATFTAPGGGSQQISYVEYAQKR